MNVWTIYLAAAMDLLYVILCTDAQKMLDDKILKYEPVYYSQRNLEDQLKQGCRTKGLNIFLNFTAYSRDFRLVLHQDRSPLTSKFGVKLGRKKVHGTNLPCIYSGIDTGHPGSRVYGQIEAGVFQGQIRLSPDLVFHILPSHQQFSEPVDFHSIIYSHKDYHFPEIDTDVEDSFISKGFRDVILEKNKTRFKRQSATSSSSSSTKGKIESKVCAMKLTADHTIWNHFINLTNQNEVRTYSYIIYLLSSHIEELNRIYGDFVFPVVPESVEEQKRYLRLQFQIQDIEIMNDNCRNKDPDFCTTRDPTKLLTLLDFYANRDDYYYDDNYNGNEDYGDKDVDHGENLENGDYGENDEKGDNGENDGKGYCLEFLFTARDMRQKRGKEAFPVLGAAYRPNGDQVFGICQEGNYGFITMCQYREDRFLPHTVTQLVLAHEIAHSIGALHDDNPEVCPSESASLPEDGYFLMHSIAQNGRELNNRRLSNCSLSHMSNTLSNSIYTDCFLSSLEEPLCGNRIVEEGEECDCGVAPCDDDPCCHGNDPKNTTASCKLKRGAQCSRSNGPCCVQETCSFVSYQDNIVCQNELPCIDEIYCHGEKHGATCPLPGQGQVRPDGWHCSENGRVCDAGSCNKSICDQINWHECQVTKSKEKLSVEEKEELCYLGCQKNKHSECITSHNESKVQLYPELVDLLYNLSAFRMSHSVRFPIGWPCNSYKGYCDSFYRCRGTEPDTPLVFLKNCFLSGDCFIFIQSHLWQWILMVCFVFVLFPIMLAKCCAIHTKSSNPEMEEKHPKQTFRQSFIRLQSVTEPLTMESVQHSFRNIRNSMNLEHIRHSLRSHHSSRPTSENIGDVELEKLNACDDVDGNKNGSNKETLAIETDALP